MKKKNNMGKEPVKNDMKKEQTEAQKVKEEAVDSMEEMEKENQLDALKKEMEQIQAEKEDLNDKYIRKVAEFENYRKNMLKQQSDLIKNGGEQILTDMLPLVDDFERALDAMQKAEDKEALHEGVLLIYNKFISFLSKNGVKAIETENVEFNTDFHEAVTLFPAPTEEQKNKIIDCISKGYTMNEKVIRFAKVVVGK